MDPYNAAVDPYGNTTVKANFIKISNIFFWKRKKILRISFFHLFGALSRWKRRKISANRHGYCLQSPQNFGRRHLCTLMQLKYLLFSGIVCKVLCEKGTQFSAQKRAQQWLSIVCLAPAAILPILMTSRPVLVMARTGKADAHENRSLLSRGGHCALSHRVPAILKLFNNRKIVQ